MEEKNISPEESLQIIEKMLADTRNRFYNNGFAFLFWGALIIIACIVDYCSDVAGHNISGYVWMMAIAIGMIVTALYYAVIAPKERRFSKLDSINGKLWISFGISYLVLGFLCVHLKVDMPPFIYCILGLCMFTSGGIYKFWSLYAGAVVFWLGAIADVLLPRGTDTLLVAIAVMFLGYLVPGYLLWKKAKKEANV
ncbi:hypothetical protein A9P82_01830 [Arachidicoccus ginsenosidimutans]|uniref:hypothetical protein n=1 Tax=Arachidicoccus sp. BS20 TaxID=1850526 RepID=UPI0007F17CFE|nr:hypothetical protein [Arachidicoccus sp. BS20]ANI88160.1 hypothetical protein A9P82_01830 [Arachidicoccus sp. BS20]